ncbi:phosphopantothenoylcysteine decarboxylase domain-containing protein [Vagococcus acidifermentans]|uniref:DNA/pantothenate metabolism flavoprotein C-terminal domain-containing protein n=1 Tax=Vagococcus acidifermentans TaxID=564710 RepID=A0A430AT53_9ENTE|nr:phosphopantothenoylcysteine decarboxylase [Vagococcus acidifermentans]RSU11227.1 hypothetical protein CBF27_09015 [Vagococcus acidifermentans]
MHILITAGGTAEKIDNVRTIINQATGRLGKEIAAAFSSAPDCRITYIHGPQADLPEKHSNISFFPVGSVQELLHEMTRQLASQPFDAVIHSMAVSDYQMDFAIDGDAFANKLAEELVRRPQDISETELAEDIRQLLRTHAFVPEKQAKKLSSDSRQLILFLGRAPKVISIIKTVQPETILVGFKLLVDVSEDVLTDAALKSIKTNNADFILANDLTKITGETHQAFLIDSGANKRYFSTKQEIAAGIRQAVISKLEERSE